MELRKLSGSDLNVSPIAFGGNVFGWTLDEKQSFDILDHFVDQGFNFIDTADTYSKWAPGNKGGESETILGKWLKQRGNRDQLVIATKLGGEMGERKKGLKPSYIKQAVESSLQRLQTDYIDLYQSHYDDPETSVEETIAAFNELIQEGKVRYIGASNLMADRIKASNDFARANGLKGYITLQPLYNLYDREKFESQYLDLVNAEKLSVLSYYALASGFLSGKYRSEADLNKSVRGGGIKKYLTERGLAILKAMEKVANETGVSFVAIAIAWQLNKPYITAPIASATRREQLDELLAGATLKLTKEQVELLDQASAY
jgi:aryl-alcohol dehydrogenase-like predicted oxidoreductase